jgi:ligand-binding SRPBCC domain-containing protein
MDFRITSGAEAKTYPGQIIAYSVRPVWNINLHWVTEITQCVEREYFIDEQRFGPYRFWHHMHRFTETDEGVVMEDILHYALPFGFVGQLLGRLFIHKKVRGIFSHREKALKELFFK